jgi:RNA polymerase sigma-70 factor (ECF subfamily)
VVAAVESLPPVRRQIYMKQKFENKSVKQIAAEMGLSPKTVANQIYQATKDIKEKIAEAMGDSGRKRVINIDET